MHESTCTIAVSFGNDHKTATVRFSGRSKPVVATLLGVDLDDDNNPIRLYFDSLFHSPHAREIAYRGWRPSGCVSTILEKVQDKGSS